MTQRRSSPFGSNGRAERGELNAFAGGGDGGNRDPALLLPRTPLGGRQLPHVLGRSGALG